MHKFFWREVGKALLTSMRRHGNCLMHSLFVRRFLGVWRHIHGAHVDLRRGRSLRGVPQLRRTRPESLPQHRVRRRTLQAAQLISDGSEPSSRSSPGLVGGLLLPVLGAVPDAAVIVASGLGASKEAAQEQVSVGMGTLAGSTVMLLTIAWGGSLWVGRCDLDAFTGKAIPKTLSHGPYASLSMTGVTTDEDTRLNAKVMMVSCLLFLIVQVPALGDADDPRLDLVGGVAALLFLAGYCAFQVLYPELSAEKMAAARLRRAKRYGHALAHHIGLSMGGILVDGDINAAALDRLFDQFDADGNGEVDTDELRAALVAMSVTMADYNVTDADVAVWLREFGQGRRWAHLPLEFCARDDALDLGAVETRLGGGGDAEEDRISTIAEPGSGRMSTRSQRRGLSLADDQPRGVGHSAAWRRGGAAGFESGG